MVSEVDTTASSPQRGVPLVKDDRLLSNTVYCQSAAVANLRSSEPPPVSVLSYAEQAVPIAAAEKQEIRAPNASAIAICKSLIAGGVAGGVSRSAVAPLERLKILLQVQNAQNAQYRGMLSGLRTIWAAEGLKGFFKGNGTNCARIVPNSAVKFYAYEQASHGLLYFVRQQDGMEDTELTPLLRLGAGATAGIIAMSATYPMDMVRGRITVQTANSPHQYRGMLHAMSTIIKEEGPLALYKGWLPSVIGVVPYVGLNFAVYETLKDMVAKQQPGGGGQANELSVLTKLACGAAAGTVGQTVAYPLDVVRRRLQMVGWKDAVHGTTAYSGMLDAFSKTVKNEGVSALYRGLLPNSVKVVPSIAIAFVTYELMKDVMGVEIRISD